MARICRSELHFAFTPEEPSGKVGHPPDNSSQEARNCPALLTSILAVRRYSKEKSGTHRAPDFKRDWTAVVVGRKFLVHAEECPSQRFEK